MKLSEEYPDVFRADIVAFWIGAAQSIACASIPDGTPEEQADCVAKRADALTKEFMKRLLPEPSK